MTTKNNVTKNDASEVKPTLNEQNEQNAQTIARLKKAIKGKKQDEKNDSNTEQETNETVLTDEQLNQIKDKVNQSLKKETISNIVRELLLQSLTDKETSYFISYMIFGKIYKVDNFIPKDPDSWIKENLTKYIDEVKKYAEYISPTGAIMKVFRISTDLYQFKKVDNFASLLDMFTAKAYKRKKEGKTALTVEEGKTYKKNGKTFEAYFIKDASELELIKTDYQTEKDAVKLKNAIGKAKQLLEKDYQVISKNTPVIDLMTEAEQLRYIKNWCKNHNYELIKKETKQIKDKEKATA